MDSFQEQAPTIRLEDIPDSIRALGGKTISIVGFMVPVQMTDQGGVQSFLLLKSRALCCYGLLPRMNEFIYVELPQGSSTEFVSDFEITVNGIIEIGQVAQEEFSYIYKIAASNVAVPAIHGETKARVENIQQRLLKEGSKF